MIETFPESIRVQLRDGTKAQVVSQELTLFGTDADGRSQSWRRDGIAEDSGAKSERDIVSVELLNRLTGKMQFFPLASELPK